MMRLKTAFQQLNTMRNGISSIILCIFLFLLLFSLFLFSLPYNFLYVLWNTHIIVLAVLFPIKELN